MNHGVVIGGGVMGRVRPRQRGRREGGLPSVGPEVDLDHRDRTPDPDPVAAIQAYARTWLPGVDASEATPTTCLYALTPDHDFVIDRDGAVTVLAGFSGHGFKFAPAIGELAARLASGSGPLPRFALGRPA